MTACQQCHEGAVDNLVMANDDFADLCAKGGVGLAEGLDFFFWAWHISSAEFGVHNAKLQGRAVRRFGFKRS
jgi:hypothetical protein